MARGNCLLCKKHKGEHCNRMPGIEPPQDMLLKILETALNPEVDHLWVWIWTFADAAWMTWLVDSGYLTEDQPREDYGFQYGGFSWSGLAPLNKITDKGRELLRLHSPVEW